MGGDFQHYRQENLRGEKHGRSGCQDRRFARFYGLCPKLLWFSTAASRGVRSWGCLPRLQLLRLLRVTLLQLLRLLRVPLFHLFLLLLIGVLFLSLLMFLVLLCLQLLAFLCLFVVELFLLLLVFLILLGVSGVWSSRTFCCRQIVRMSVGSGAAVLCTGVCFVASRRAVSMEIARSGCSNRSRASMIV